MIRRVTDPDELARLSWACGLVGRFDDGSEYLESSNVVGWGEPLRAAFFFKPIDTDSVEGHLMVHPECRGKEAIQAGRDCLAGVRRLGLSVVAPVPRARRDVRLYARQVGLVCAGETQETIFMHQGRS